MRSHRRYYHNARDRVSTAVQSDFLNDNLVFKFTSTFQNLSIALHLEKSNQIAAGLYQFMNDEVVMKMLSEARVHSNNRQKQVAVWASRELRKLKQKVEQQGGNTNAQQGGNQLRNANQFQQQHVVGH